MSLDPERAAFVKTEYRFETTTDATTASTYPGARVVEIETNIATTAQAAAAAAELLAFYKTPAQVFQVTVQGIDVADLANFATSPPAFLADFPDYATGSGVTMLPTSVSINYNDLTTTMTIRG